MTTNVLKIAGVCTALLFLSTLCFSQSVVKIEKGDLTNVLAGISSMEVFSTDEIGITVFTVGMEERIPGSEGHEFYTRLYIVISEVGTHAASNVYLIKNLTNVDKMLFKKTDKSDVLLEFLEGPYIKRGTRQFKINSEKLGLELLR